jgi:3-hydroxyisobutyrate dehydrogenase-like beta-hydroxyacid dehydrogenase
MLRVHFLGVGKMGLPMASHLAHGGHRVSVADPSNDRLDLAAQAGLARGDDHSIAQADVMISSLPSDQALLVVAADVAARARPGAIYVDTSTVSVDASARAAALCADRGIPMLRVTVSGNNKMAEAAALTVMASGPRAAYERAEPLLSCWGPQRFYLGEGEQARLMKLVVNLLIAQTSAMLAEGLTLGRKGGLDWQDMWQVLCASAVGSPILKAKSVQLSQRDFTPTFTVEQMIKDLDLIESAARDVHAPLPQTAATLQLMHAAVAQGEALHDYAAIIKVLERSAGLAVDLERKP